MQGRRWSMPSLNAARRLPGATLLLAAVTAVVFLSGHVTVLVQYDRDAIAAGQLWRILTGHLAHFSGEHLFWDLLMFVVLGGICELRDRRRMLLCAGLSAFAISAGVLLMMPSMQIYRGLSGVDSALFVLLAVDWLGRTVRTRELGRTIILLGGLLAFAGKTAFEYVTGGTIFVDGAVSGMVPVPLAHVIGGLAGLIVANGAMILRRVEIANNGRIVDRHPRASLRMIDPALTKSSRGGESRQVCNQR